LPALGNHPYARGRNVHTVGGALADDFRVPGNDLHTCLGRCLAHVGDDLAQFGNRKAFFDHEGRRKPLRPSARDCEVIDGPVHRDVTDGSTRKTPG
jgi:hypothetical protein